MKKRLRGTLHKAAWVIGRRGASLLVLSAVFGIYGTMMLLWSQAPDIDIPRTMRVIVAIAPIHIWGWAWVIVALLSAIQALLPSRSGRMAFTLLSFLSGIWASGYIAGWIVMEPPRDVRGWLSGLLWICILLLTLILAGWKEDPRRYRRDRYRDLAGGV